MHHSSRRTSRYASIRSPWAWSAFPAVVRTTCARSLAAAPSTASQLALTYQPVLHNWCRTSRREASYTLPLPTMAIRVMCGCAAHCSSSFGLLLP